VTESIVDRLADIFERRGAEAYLGEDVTMAEHMLQCAALAEAEGAPDTLVAAALLHDVGYFTGEFEFSVEDTTDSHHDAVGARFLETYFPALVTDPVRLHVAAKRYLCAVEPDYHTKLSSVSKHTLSLQGGPMSAAEITDFQSLPFYREAVQLRLWDDGGKAVGLRVRSFAEYRPLLETVKKAVLFEKKTKKLLSPRPPKI
jgi:phosphonate degradation associated HDIG domain protein